MVRRSPCEFYIKYLIVHPDGFDNDEIREKIRSLQLDYIGEWYVEKLRSECVPPSTFYPYDERHVKSQRFLVKEQLRSVFIRNEVMKEALSLLSKPNAKETIESCFITGTSAAWIKNALKKRGCQSSIEALNLYYHYFWNLDLLDTSELKIVVDARWKAEPSGDRDVQNQAAIAEKTRYSDPRRLMAYAPVSPLAGLMNQLRMGFLPEDMEIGRIAAAARTAAVIRSFESVLTSRPEFSRDYALTAKIMSEILETVGSPEEDLQHSLRELALRTIEEPVPYIGELSEGHHTVDVAPVEIIEPDGKKDVN